jgi:hypothetical protein
LALRDPLYGDLLLDIPTVLAHVAKEHGRVTAEDIAALRATLYEKLALPAGFLTHAALFAEKSARINLEEVIAPTALFTIFEGTFAHHPSFLPTLGRFYEATPDRLKHTVPNLVAFFTPALPFITKLSNPSPSVFGAFGLVPPVPSDPAVIPPSPSKRALKKAGRKEKQGPKLGQHDALLAYLAQQGITVPPHLVAGALTLPPVSPQSSSSTNNTPRTSMTAPTPEHLYCFVHGWTLSHGWSKGKWQGKHCRTLHAPSTPYTQAQLNAQDPRTGGNANIYVVCPRHPLTCSPCLPSRASPPGNALSLISPFPSSGRRQGKSSPPTFLPSFVSPPTPTQWSPRGNRAEGSSPPHALPFFPVPSPGLPTHLTPPHSLTSFSPNLSPQSPTSASPPPLPK